MHRSIMKPRYTGVFVAVAAMILAGCNPAAPTNPDPPSAYSETTKNRDLISVFEQNYIETKALYLGVQDSTEYRDTIQAIHGRVIIALVSDDDEAFRSAILEFIETNRRSVNEAAGLARGFAQGSGPQGSSAAIASSGANAGVNIAASAATYAADASPLACTYLYSAANRLEGCTVEKGSALYQGLQGQQVTISNFSNYVS